MNAASRSHTPVSNSPRITCYCVSHPRPLHNQQTSNKASQHQKTTAMGLFGWISTLKKRNRSGESESMFRRTSKADDTCSTSITDHVHHESNTSQMTASTQQRWGSKRLSMASPRRRRTRSSTGRLSSSLLESFDGEPSSLLDLSSLTTASWTNRANKNDPLSNRNKMRRQKSNRRRARFLMEQVEQQTEVTNLIRGDGLLRQTSGRDDTWNTSSSSINVNGSHRSNTSASCEKTATEEVVVVETTS